MRRKRRVENVFAKEISLVTGLKCVDHVCLEVCSCCWRTTGGQLRSWNKVVERVEVQEVLPLKPIRWVFRLFLEVMRLR